MRPKIQPVKKIVATHEPDFIPNKATSNAKLLHKYTEFEVELWMDVHYHIRKTKGDIDGRREGIEEGKVQLLIIKAFKYLLDIYLRYPRFTFINFIEEGKSKPKERLVLKQIHEDGTLNVVVEIHFLTTSKYEVTIITAMEIDDFKVADGQYVISLVENRVVLRRSVNKSFQEIYKLYL